MKKQKRYYVDAYVIDRAFFDVIERTLSVPPRTLVCRCYQKLHALRIAKALNHYDECGKIIERDTLPCQVGSAEVVCKPDPRGED